ncbi:hypothetical protein CsSME_00039979 [Camellia sinensis var. sinensis]
MDNKVCVTYWLNVLQVSISNTRLRLLSANGYLGNRQFNVLNESSKQVKGEANRILVRRGYLIW